MIEDRQKSLFKRSDHANRGRSFELELMTVHDMYRMQGKADIVKNPSEFIFITERQYREKAGFYAPGMFARTADGKCLMRSRSDIDFSGGGKGFSVTFDAKLCSDRHFPIANIKVHQIIRLKQSARCGCISGFLIKMEKYSRVFFIPVGYVDDRWVKLQMQSGRRAKPGTASLSIGDMEANGTEILKDINGLYNWLDRLVFIEEKIK